MEQQSTDKKQVLVFLADMDDAPSIIRIDTLYDPDKPKDEPNGYIIPTPGTLITEPLTRLVYIVYKVEGTKTFYEPHKDIVISEDEKSYVVSSGNELFELYYDDTVLPTKLEITSLLIVGGSGNVEYRLMKENPDGTEVPISVYLHADTGKESDRVPLRPFVTEKYVAAKQCTNCHTYTKLADGESIRADIYNKEGIRTMKVWLTARKAHILNDLASAHDPIVDFRASCLQEDGDHWYLYTKQDPEHLDIRAELVYASGKKMVAPVDNKKCFALGLANLLPAFQARPQQVVIKYILGSRETAKNEEGDGINRYLSIVKDVMIVNNKSVYNLKICTVPQFNKVEGVWELRFFAYLDVADVYDITPYVTYAPDAEFNGSLVNDYQRIRLVVDLAKFLDLDVETYHQQDVFIKLRPPAIYDKYWIKDYENADMVYGIDTVDQRRPVIHWDETLDQYFIPTSLIENKNAFLKSFYLASNPPYDPRTETRAPEPTHFTIRSPLTGNVLVAMPIPVDEFTQVWNTINVGSPGSLVNQTVIVEFLNKIGDNYQIMWGVPVEVLYSSTGYNTGENNLVYP
jgi:hypothetical protein